MKIELDSMQYELIMTALGEMHWKCPANIPAKQNYKDLIENLKSQAKRQY